MAHLVIAYPELQQNDFNWIQAYRKQHDRQFTLIEPHFTLVFAVQDLDKDSFLSEVRQKASGVMPFDFELKVATSSLDVLEYANGSVTTTDKIEL